MPATRHRATVSHRQAQRAIPPETSATKGSRAPMSPCESAGTARDCGQPPSTFSAPVLIHYPSSPAADDHSDRDAPSVLLLDGLPGPPFMWHRLLPVLRHRGLQPSTVKRPDQIATPGADVDVFATDAADIARLLDGQQRSPAVIVGYGLGAGTALSLAATAPRHVRALVLVAPVAGPQSISVTDRLLAAPMVGPALTCLGFRAAGLALHVPSVRRRVLTTRAGLNPRAAREFVRGITFGSTWRDFTSEQRRLVSEARRHHQQQSNIDCPILIVAGACDRLADPRVVIALHRRLSGSEIVTSGAGQLIPIDDPDAVADAILRALRREYRDSLSARPDNGKPASPVEPAQYRVPKPHPTHRNRDRR